MKDRICIITVVSDQTAPSVIFLKWCLKKYSQSNIHIVLISTNAMEEKNRSNHIRTAIDINKDICIDTIQVDEYDLENIKLSLDREISISEYKNIIVNITGGTKIMSLGVYLYFQERRNANIFYQILGTNKFIELCPNKQIHDLFEILTIEEYFKAYGIDLKYSNSCVKDLDFNSKVLPLIESKKNIIKILIYIQNIKRVKKIIDKNKCIDLEEFNYTELSNILFGNKYTEIKKDDVFALVSKLGFDPRKIRGVEFRYITGGWFEELVYQKLKKEKNIDDDKIALNAIINIREVRNELDVVYIDSKNKLKIIECKSFIDDKTQADLLVDTLYKIQALKSQFGLSVDSSLYTMSIINKESALNRAESFKIDIVDRNKLLPPLNY